MKFKIKLVIGLLFWLVLFNAPSHGSGGGFSGVAALTTGGQGDTGIREWLALRGNNGLLSGRPRRLPIALVTVHAPGLEEGHLLLRELKKDEVHRSLLLTAPVELAERIRRVTLFFPPGVGNRQLLAHDDGRWRPVAAQPLRVADGDSRKDLLGFTVTGLGFYWVVDGQASARLLPEADEDGAVSARQLLEGSLLQGFKPVLGAMVLLLAAGVTSFAIHRKESRWHE